MKRVLSLLVFLAVLLLPVTVSAASVQAQLSGPDTVRAGDTITLTFSLNGSDIHGVSGTLSYDSNQVTLTGTRQLIGGDWQVEFHENNFLAYDNALAAPINGSAQLFAVTFQVSGSLEPGTPISVSCIGITASDGASDTDCGAVGYSTVLAAAPVTQEQVPTDPKESTAQEPVPSAPTEPTEQETAPTQTVPTTAAPTEPAESEEMQELSGIPAEVLILTAVVCLAAGVCVGIVLDHKVFNKK